MTAFSLSKKLLSAVQQANHQDDILKIVRHEKIDETFNYECLVKNPHHPRSFFTAEQNFSCLFLLTSEALKPLQLITATIDETPAVQYENIGQGVLEIGTRDADLFMIHAETALKLPLYADLTAPDDIAVAVSLDTVQHINNANHQAVGYVVALDDNDFSDILMEIHQLKSYLLGQSYVVEYHASECDICDFHPSSDTLCERETYISSCDVFNFMGKGE